MKNQHIWIIAIIIAFIAGGVLIGRKDLASMLPYALVLICPLMMILMMGDHKHK